jgi:hypothetical protein
MSNVGASSKRFFFFSFFFFIVLLVQVVAFGVSPGKLVVDYVANEPIDVSFYTYNGDQHPMYVEMRRGSGDLNQYITCDMEDEVHEVPPETGYYFNCVMTVPLDLEAGYHEGKYGIVLIDPNEAEDALFKLEQVVLTRVEMTVPYPDKYLRLESMFSEAIEGEDISYELQLKNLGTKEIYSAEITVELYDHKDSVVAVEAFEPLSLMTNDEETLAGVLATAPLPGGIYSAVVTAAYDEVTDIHKEDIFLGSEMIYVSLFPETEVSAGEISQVSFQVKSNWVEDLQGYASLVFEQDGQAVFEAQTDTQTISPENEATLSAFVDFKHEGTYDVRVITYAVGGQEYVDSFEGVISVSSGGLAWWVYLLIGVVVLVLIVAILVGILNRNRNL